MIRAMTDTILLEFSVDANNVIIAINGSWDEFADANDAPQLKKQHVVGKSLFDYISGNVTRQFVQKLLDIVRQKNTSACFDYRCDAPNLRRYLQMRLMANERGEVRISNYQLHTEPRVAPIFFIRSNQRDRHTRVRCSICNLLKQAEQWVEAESLLKDKEPLTVPVIYGVCPQCQHQLKQLQSSPS